MKTLETILLTHLFNLTDEGVLEVDEEHFDISRQAFIQELKESQRAMIAQELDLTNDYQDSISLLENVNDTEFDVWKNQLKREGELLEG